MGLNRLRLDATQTRSVSYALTENDPPRTLFRQDRLAHEQALHLSMLSGSRIHYRCQFAAELPVDLKYLRGLSRMLQYGSNSHPKHPLRVTTDPLLSLGFGHYITVSPLVRPFRTSIPSAANNNLGQRFLTLVLRVQDIGVPFHTLK